jgi:FkbM family methyltransferase
VALRTLGPLLGSRPERELRMQLDYAVALRQTVTPDFFFVQIGACDGRMDDPIYGWVRAFHWRGVLVEPQGRYFTELVENYAGEGGLEFRQVAIDSVRRTRTLWTVADLPEAPYWAGLLASFQREVILSHREFLPGIEELLRGEEVQCLPLNDLLEEAETEHIDLLQIDVEGFDHELIMALDFDHFRPSIIRFEHVHLSDDQHAACVERLLANDYLVALEERDTLAYRPDAAPSQGVTAAIEGPTRIQGETDRRLEEINEAHAAHVAELERRLAAATSFTGQVEREAAAFREQSLDEQAEFLNARIAEANKRADLAERRVAEFERRR